MKTLGIMGGMGAEATIRFCQNIIDIRRPHVKGDSDHLPFILNQNTQIPNCSNAMLGIGPSPSSALVSDAKKLESMGVAFLCIPCHTAHNFIEDVSKAVSIPVIDMVDLALLHVVETMGPSVSVGILASAGTVTSGLYQRRAARIAADLRIVCPTSDSQSEVSDATHGERGVKAGYTDERVRGILTKAAENLTLRGAQVVIAACTEVSIGMPTVPRLLPSSPLAPEAAVPVTKSSQPGSPSNGVHPSVTVLVLDPMRLMAEEALRRCGAHAAAQT